MRTRADVPCELQVRSPVWLKRKGASTHVILIRQEPLGGRQSGGSAARVGLGFSFKDQPAADGAGVEALVTSVQSGGALWLHGQVAAGDAITHVDGKRTTGGTAMFKGTPFSRTRLVGRKGEDGSGFECDIVRMEALPEKELEKVEEYKKAVLSQPPLPPANRINANSDNQFMAAPLINGLDIKAAARVSAACIFFARVCARGVCIRVFGIIPVPAGAAKISCMCPDTGRVSPRTCLNRRPCTLRLADCGECIPSGGDRVQQ